jgi:soluble cytochrome b562
VDIWSAIPKSNDKIDAEGFVTLYKDIDNLFEEEEDDASGDDGEEADLKEAFDLLAGASSTFSSAQLRKWEEITSLIDEEGMLGEDEFNELWKKSVGNSSGMDYTAFVKFNEALDDLFVLEDEEIEEVLAESGSNVEDEEVTVAEEAPKPASKPKPIITDTDLPPAVLFSQLADENYLVSQQDLLSRWGELRDMLSGGDLTQTELEELWNGVATAPGSTDKLDEEGFLILFDKIDELFEDEDEMEGNAGSEPNKITSVSKEPEMEDLKEELLELIQDLDRLSEEEGRQPCGLDCTELEQERVLEVVSDLEKEPYNRVSSVGGGSNVVPKEELVGNWDLIYSSSSTMKYNEGLSGLAGGLTRFGGVQQRLSATKYLSDVEYVEQVVGKVGGQSFEVRITG